MNSELNCQNFEAIPSKFNIWESHQRAKIWQGPPGSDKGVALVVIDKKDYILKMNQLLEDKNTYSHVEDGPH